MAKQNIFKKLSDMIKKKTQELDKKLERKASEKPCCCKNASNEKTC